MPVMRHRLFKPYEVVSCGCVESVADHRAGSQVVGTQTNGWIADSDLTRFGDTNLGVNLHRYARCL